MIARTVRKAISVTSVFFSFFTSLILRSQLYYKMDYIYYKVSRSDNRGGIRAHKAR